jgi:hypothetical protein
MPKDALNFCGWIKLRILVAYDPATFGRKNRPGIWSREQAQHRMGNRESLGSRGRAPDF